MLSNPARQSSLHCVLPRLGLFLLVWLGLAGTDPSSWIIGVPAIALATLAAVRLKTPPSGRLRLLGLARFVPFFLVESIRGGIDVASRVMRPRLRVDPGVRIYDMHLSGLNARVFFLNSVSLLPGTLSADMRDGQLHVHALDVHDNVEASLQRLELRVADLFGEDLLGHAPGATCA